MAHLSVKDISCFTCASQNGSEDSLKLLRFTLELERTLSNRRIDMNIKFAMLFGLFFQICKLKFSQHLFLLHDCMELKSLKLYRYKLQKPDTGENSLFKSDLIAKIIISLQTRDQRLIH